MAVSCELRDEARNCHGDAALAGSMARRASTPPRWCRNRMGAWSATIPAQAHNTVVEFYIQATDGANARTCTYPNDEGQTTNCSIRWTTTTTGSPCGCRDRSRSIALS
ncbi:MAG: hypothetical protein R3F11_23610 [Verrucomicrobiales bacterium]